MTVRRWLAIVMLGVGVLAVAYGTIAYATSADPLRGLLLALIAAPAIAPVTLGALMLRGHVWALTAARVYLLVVLAVGAWLHAVVGVGVFSPATFGVTFVGACVTWLALSYVAERRRGR